MEGVLDENELPYIARKGSVQNKRDGSSLQEVKCFNFDNLEVVAPSKEKDRNTSQYTKSVPTKRVVFEDRLSDKQLPSYTVPSMAMDDVNRLLVSHCRESV